MNKRKKQEVSSSLNPKRRTRKKSKKNSSNSSFSFNSINPENLWITRPCDEVLNKWLEFFEYCEVSSLDEEKWKNCKVSNIQFDIDESIDLNSLNGLSLFIKCCTYCDTWLSNQLKTMGFKTNITGYLPITEANSVHEMLVATCWVIQIAYRQRQWIIERYYPEQL